jgi:hypothetical protein
MRFLVYIEAGSIDAIDNALGSAVDSNDIDKYATLTIDGEQLLYERGSDSASDNLNAMAAACEGITEFGG